MERETLHISDDSGRIALVDTKTYDGGVVGSPTSEIRYQIGNHLQSASLELDDTAAIITYEEYHPFGTSAYRLGRTSTEVAQKRYRYVGKECDNETGIYYYGARYYAAWLGKFTSVDPRKDDYPMWSTYVYAGNGPVTMTDVNGEGPSGGGGDTQLVETTITLDDGTTQTIMALPEVVITPEISDSNPIYVSGIDSLPNDNTTVVMPLALDLPSDKDKALAKINEFINDGDNTTVWTNISKADFAQSLKGIINDPNSVTQGSHPFCGIAACLNVGAEYNPETLVDMAISLYRTGKSEVPYLSLWDTNEPIRADSDLFGATNFHGLNSAEFILQTSLRNSFNNTGYNNNPNAPRGSSEEFFNNVQGVTWPSDVSTILERYLEVNKEDFSFSMSAKEIQETLSNSGSSLIALTSWNELHNGGSFDPTSLHYVKITNLTFNSTSNTYTLEFWNPHRRNFSDKVTGLTEKQLNNSLMMFWTFNRN